MRTQTLLKAASVTVVAGLTAATAAQVGTSPASAKGRPSHVSQVVSTNFPDPGFAKFGSTYYLYSTGDGFPAATSTKPQARYTKRGNTSPTGNYPIWNGVAPRFARHHWAPHVFRVTKDAKPLYVMYFTAWNKQGRWNNDCIGVATSRSPIKGFKYVGTRVCAANKSFEAIDPTMYRAKDGKRYLAFKQGRYSGGRSFSIVSVPVDAATGTKVVAGGRKTLASTSASETMEAPSFVAHGGRVWMFVSRGAFDGNRYRTEVWSAPTFHARGGFRKVKNLTMNNQKGQPFLSPGGATVIQDGKVTRIAFHATLASNRKVRQAYVGQLRWDKAGKPWLY